MLAHATLPRGERGEGLGGGTPPNLRDRGAAASPEFLRGGGATPLETRNALNCKNTLYPLEQRSGAIFAGTLWLKLFRLWHKVRDGRIDRSQLRLRSIPIQKRLFALGERYLNSSNRDVRNLAALLFDHIKRLFLVGRGGRRRAYQQRS